MSVRTTGFPQDPSQRPERAAVTRAGLGRALGRASQVVLLGVLLAAIVHQAAGIVAAFAVGTDLTIPLRAAERWASGQPAYLASDFLNLPPKPLPFLYPPYVLPFLVPLLQLPRPLVIGAWELLCIGAALVVLDRFAIPRRWWPLALAWTPLAEAIWNGNLHVILLAAFACAFWQRAGARPWTPQPRDLATRDHAARTGLLATAVGVVKVSQVQAWVLVARRNWRAAVLGAALLGAVVLATVPFTGLSIYVDWLHQVQRAANPAWHSIGWPLAEYLPEPLPLAITLASIPAVALLPRRDAAVWTGLLMIVASPTILNYSWIFALPAMLRVRRDVALVVAFGWTTYQPGLSWAAFALLAGTLLASYRFPVFAPSGEAPAAHASRPDLAVEAA